MSGQTGGLPVPETTTIVAATAGRLDPPLTEDDWPFPFLPGRKWAGLSPCPTSHLMAILAMVSVIWVLGTAEPRHDARPALLLPGRRVPSYRDQGNHGVGTLVFGTTWIVASVVITAILTLILAGELDGSFDPADTAAHQLRLPHLVFAGGVPDPGAFVAGSGLADGGGGLVDFALSAALFCGNRLRHFAAKGGVAPVGVCQQFARGHSRGLCEYLSMVTGFRAALSA